MARTQTSSSKPLPAKKNTKSKCATTEFKAFHQSMTVVSNKHRTTVTMKVEGTPRPQYRTHGTNTKGKFKVFSVSTSNVLCCMLWYIFLGEEMLAVVNM